MTPSDATHSSEVEPLKIIRQWHRGLSISHKAHAVAANAFHHRNLYLGLPVVLLSTIAGTAVFSSLESSPETWAKIVVGLLSLSAAILASLQTFLRYSELSEKHKASSVKYGALRREIEEALATCTEGYSICTKEFMGSIRARWDIMDQDSPAIPSRILDPIAAEFKLRDL